MIGKKLIEAETRLKDMELRIRQMERDLASVENVQRKCQEVLNDEAAAMTQLSELIGKMSEKLKTHDMIQYRMIRIIEKFKDMFEEMGYTIDIPEDPVPEDTRPPEPTLSPAPPEES